MAYLSNLAVSSSNQLKTTRRSGRNKGIPCSSTTTRDLQPSGVTSYPSPSHLRRFPARFCSGQPESRLDVFVRPFGCSFWGKIRDPAGVVAGKQDGGVVPEWARLSPWRV